MRCPRVIRRWFWVWLYRPIMGWSRRKIQWVISASRVPLAAHRMSEKLKVAVEQNKESSAEAGRTAGEVVSATQELQELLHASLQQLKDREKRHVRH